MIDPLPPYRHLLKRVEASIRDNDSGMSNRATDCGSDCASGYANDADGTARGGHDGGDEAQSKNQSDSGSVDDNELFHLHLSELMALPMPVATELRSMLRKPAPTRVSWLRTRTTINSCC